MEKVAIRSIWADAPKSGAVIGVIVTVMLFLKVWLTGLGGILLIAELLAVGYCIYYFSRLRSQMYGAWGYTYGQSMSYIMVMMLFAGFIYGIGYYFVVNYIAAGYFSTALDQSLEQMRGAFGGLVTDESIENAFQILRSPLYWIFYGIMAMLIYGGLIGLFVSIFVKRDPEQLNNHNDEQQS